MFSFGLILFREGQRNYFDTLQNNADIEKSQFGIDELRLLTTICRGNKYDYRTHRAGTSYVDEAGGEPVARKRAEHCFIFSPFLSFFFVFFFSFRGLRVVTTEVTTLHHKKFVDGIVNRRV